MGKGKKKKSTWSPIRGHVRQISVHEPQMKNPSTLAHETTAVGNGVERALDRESGLRGRGARIKRTHTSEAGTVERASERVCSRNQDVDNKKPFVAHLPESAGQSQGFPRTKTHAG